MVQSEEARRKVDYALEALIASCMTWQEAIYNGDTFDSPEAMEKFLEDVRITLQGESNMVVKRIGQFFETLDKETVY